jgi:hypothetical protein
MRTPIYVLVAALFFGGCTHYTVTPAGAPSSRPDRIQEPEPEPVEPLELDVGRPSGGQLLLQTNRPAYVAIFEIIPNRGVTLIYPAAAHQQNMMLSGLTWVPLWWSPKRVTFNSDRYIYAVASEEPLQLSGETFMGGYFLRVLGARVFGAESPYSTMRAVSRTVVPDVADEAWAEDVYVLTPRYLTETYRTARIYCAGGKVFDVPEDMVARIWCPTRTRVVIIDASRPRSRDYPVGRPVRPDSVYGQGGTRVRLEPRRPRGPIVRVVDPSGRDRDDRDNDRGRRGRDARDMRNDRDNEVEKADRVKRGPMRDAIKELEKEKKEQEKQERENRRREAEEARRREAEERKAGRDERKEERDARKDERKDERDARKEEREERKDERKDEPKQQGQPHEENREQKREEKQDKQEEKREEKRDEAKARGTIKDAIRAMKEKEKEKEKKDKP